jgi:hypothetical protein
MHGVTDASNLGFVHRNLMTVVEFQRFLLQATPPFVSVQEALDGPGTALTVDDSTWASVEAAKLARGLGHEVTLYVNPEQIITSSPYPLCVLNAMLDAWTTGEIELEAGNSYNPTQRHPFRAHVKRLLRRLPDTPSQHLLLRELAGRLGLVDVVVPAHLRPPTVEALVALRGSGVHIGNHGWTHVEHASIDPRRSASEITRAAEWITREIGASCHTFAVPYGEALPGEGVLEQADVVWLLVDDRVDEGLVRPRVYNRGSLYADWRSRDSRARHA